MLEAINLTKRFNDHTALHNLNLKINGGDIFCLLGANGAGKTTTINLFLNFIAPTEGQALINGMDVTKHSQETKRFIAYIPENVLLYPNLTGLENLAFFSGLTGNHYSKPALTAFLIQCGLPENTHQQRISTYSKGMRQKVGIAIALAKDAKALLLDEPTSGLDPKASNEFAELLTQLSQSGVAILMATHDLFRAKETGTHLGIMKMGHLVEQMTSEQINHSDLEKLYLKHMHA